MSSSVVLVKKLKDDGLWDDSVIVIYGDHFGPSFSPLTKPELQVLSGLVGHEYTVLDHFRVPLIVHVPGQKTPGRITDTVGQMDIMPTIIDLLGLDSTNVAMFGRSVFVGGSPIVPLRYYAPEGTFVTDDVFFRPGIGYDDATARRVSDGKPIAREFGAGRALQQSHWASRRERALLDGAAFLARDCDDRITLERSGPRIYSWRAMEPDG